MTWIHINAWREILALVFDGFSVQVDVSPDWLVNPETRRRLKLDLLYPDIGVAIRFQGLQGQARRPRPSLEEEHQQAARDTARSDLCEAHGISLVVIDVTAAEPKAALREMSAALSSASRRMAKRVHIQADQGMLIEQVSLARGRLEAVARRVRGTEDLQVFTELWQDRQYAATPQPLPLADSSQPRAYMPGMAVRHAAFGKGVVEAVQPDRNDTLVTVRFADGTQKTFAASLVISKLIPQA